MSFQVKIAWPELRQNSVEKKIVVPVRKPRSGIDNPVFPTEDGNHVHLLNGNNVHKRNEETVDLDNENHDFDEHSDNTKYWTKRRVAILVVLILLLIGVTVAFCFIVIGYINTSRELEKKKTSNEVASPTGSFVKPVHTLSNAKSTSLAKLSHTTGQSILSTQLWRHGATSFPVTVQNEQDKGRTVTYGLPKVSSAPPSLVKPTATVLMVSNTTSGSPSLGGLPTTVNHPLRIASTTNKFLITSEASSVKKADSVVMPTRFSPNSLTSNTAGSVTTTKTTEMEHVETSVRAVKEKMTPSLLGSLSTTQMPKESNRSADLFGNILQEIVTETLVLSTAGLVNTGIFTTQVNPSAKQSTSSSETETAFRQTTRTKRPVTTLAESASEAAATTAASTTASTTTTTVPVTRTTAPAATTTATAATTTAATTKSATTTESKTTEPTTTTLTTARATTTTAAITTAAATVVSTLTAGSTTTSTASAAITTTSAAGTTSMAAATTAAATSSAATVAAAAKTTTSTTISGAVPTSTEGATTEASSATTTTTATAATTTATATAAKPKLTCHGNDVLCSDYTCIKSHELCDGVKNCPRGEDEFNCQNVTRGK